MKKFVRGLAPIRANRATGRQKKFTADDIMLLLSQIGELKGSKVAFSETPEGDIQFIVGDTAYQIVDDLSPYLV